MAYPDPTRVVSIPDDVVRFLGLSALLALGCAQPQTRVEPRAQPLPFKPPARQDRCPAQVLSYEEPSSIGPSAAALVAKFGNHRMARRIEPAATASSRSIALAAEARLSFSYVGGTIKVVGCPSDLVTLIVPVKVTLELSEAPPLSFDAQLSAMGPSHAYVRGRAQVFGAETSIAVELDDDDVEITLLERPDLPYRPRWSSLCNADAGSFLGDFFPAIPGPLLATGTNPAMACFKQSETSSGAEPAGGSQPPVLFLNNVNPRGCREIARGNVATFRGQVTAGPTQSWMPQAAPVEIGVDMDTGVAKLAFRTPLPPSDLVRSFHACPRPPMGARFAYWLELQRGPNGVQLKSEVFELMYYCEDVIVRCGYDASKAQ